MRRILLIGATGAFGSRLAEMLAKLEGIELILAARGHTSLEDLRLMLMADGANASLKTISNIRPWLVIDAAGPFQDSDYALPRETVGCGAHYIDLSDGRAFVAGFPPALDSLARTKAVLAVTGVSSTPALSHAALKPLVAGWLQLNKVTVAISPGAKAPYGLSVIQAILSYAGKPVQVFSNGEWRKSYGWSGARKLAMPGLGQRWVSLCETPDLDLLPKEFPVHDSALFLAGLELSVMHLGLTALSTLVRWRWIKSLRPLSGVLRALASLLKTFGSDRGGMIVQAQGRDDQDRPITARWSLVAEANTGPNVPVAAAAALTRALLNEQRMEPGARACTGLLTHDAILAELFHLPISTRTEESLHDDPSLFRRLIGRQFDQMPKTVKIVHAGKQDSTFTGRAVARSGRTFLVKILMRVIGIPKSGHHSVTVKIAPDRTGETWFRQFGDTCFSSRLAKANRLGIFEESFGPVRFAFDLRPMQSGIKWVFLSWKIFGLPIPKWAAPRVKAKAQDANGQYRFSVVVNHPWLGLLFAYRGMLEVIS